MVYRYLPILLVVGMTHAQDLNTVSEVEPASTTAPEVVRLEGVTSHGQEDLILKRQENPNSNVIVGKEQINQFNNNTIGEVLKRVQGITFNELPGESKDVRLRGLDKEYTQVLINGKRAPGAGEKREFQVDLIPASMIERIEITRSPTAAMDSQGITGTINIILKKAPSDLVFNTTVGVNYIEGEKYKPNASILYGDRIGSFGYLLGVNAQQRQGLKNKYKDIFNELGELTKVEREDEKRDFDDLQITPQFNWTPSKNDEINLDPYLFLSSEKKEKVKSKLNAALENNGQEVETEDKLRTNWLLGGDWKHTFSDNLNAQLGINYKKSLETKEKDKQILKGNGDLDKVEKEDEDKDDREFSSAISINTFVGDNHTIKTGVEYIDKVRTKEKKKVEIKGDATKNKSEGKDSYTIKERRFNGYVLDEITITEDHIVTPGIRYEWFDTQSKAGAIEQYYENMQLNPSLHYLFHVTKQTNVRAGLAKTVRRPKFDDMIPYVDEKDGDESKPDKAGNPNLKSETANGVDIGLEYFFQKNKGMLSANVFYRDISDKIESQVILNNTNGRYETTPVNVGDATLAGLELEARRNMGFLGLSGLVLTANATFLNATVTHTETGEELPFKDTPSYICNIGIDHALPAKISWGLNYNRTGEREHIEIENGKRSESVQKAENVLDVYVKKQLFKNFTITLSAENLLEAEKDKMKTIYNDDATLSGTEHETAQYSRSYSLKIIGAW